MLITAGWGGRGGAQQREGCCRGAHPPFASVMEWGVVDSGERGSRVVSIKEAGVVSGRRKFPGVGRKPLPDLWSPELPGDS